MPLIDLILNLAALLLWLNWRAIGFDPLLTSPPTTLIGTLRRADTRPAHRWPLLLGLLGLLFFRAVLYWQIGPAAEWTPSLKLGAITLSFRNDFFTRALMFSALSFVFTAAVFYFWLVLLSVVNGRSEEAEPFQKLIRLHLGRVDSWPWPIKLLLPLIITAGLWLVLSPLFTKSGILPRATSARHHVEQAAAIGLAVYLTWKYLIAALLFLYLLTSYVFFGNHAFWTFISATGKNFVKPLRFLPLRLGKVDLAPLIGVALALFGGELAGRGLTALYLRLPL